VYLSAVIFTDIWSLVSVTKDGCNNVQCWYSTNCAI